MHTLNSLNEEPDVYTNVKQSQSQKLTNSGLFLGIRQPGMCCAWAHMSLCFFPNGGVSSTQITRKKCPHQCKSNWKSQHICGYTSTVSLLLCYFFLSARNKVWNSVHPSSQREALVSPVTTHSTCSGCCRRRARSRTSSYTSGKTTTSSNLSGRRPTFTRNKSTQRTAFGLLKNKCDLLLSFTCNLSL